MSGYPSSADLAAFRQSMLFSGVGDSTDGLDFTWEMHPDRLGLSAWPEEIAHGIGFRGVTHSLSGWLYGRAGASALRSRAFERGVYTIRGLDGIGREEYRVPART